MYLRGWGGLHLGGDGIRVLLFHDICRTHAAQFGELLDWVQAGPGFLAPRDFEAILAGRIGTRPGAYLLTFDDGFKSSCWIAERILAPRGIRAIFLVCPGLVGLEGSAAQEFVAARIYRSAIRPDQVNDDLLPLSWEDVRVLAASGHTVGSHSFSHRVLSEIRDPTALRHEVCSSGDALADRLGRPVAWFAYPFGNNDSINAAAYRLIRERYMFCCTNLRGALRAGDEPLYIWRESLDLREALNYTKFVARGGLDWSYACKRRKLKRKTASGVSG
jgi:peptidoglycan/xylan/chitin deacetylase (PgdA/CDA1 family)